MVYPNVEYPATQDPTLGANSKSRETEKSIADSAESKNLHFEEGMLLPNAARMIVLVDNLNIPDVEFARKIWSMASAARMDVIYLTLIRSNDELLSAERRLTSLASVTRDVWFNLETKIVRGRNWLPAVRSIWRPGDIVICLAEQVTGSIFSQQKSLYLALMSTLETPVYVLSGYYRDQRPGWQRKLILIPYWLSFLAIISGFYSFEARIYQTEKGLVGTILIFLIFLCEVGLIWIWNSIQI